MAYTEATEMAPPMQSSLIRTLATPRVALWLITAVVLSALLALLTAAIIDNPMPSQDVAVMDWVVGRDWPGVGTFFEVVSFLTGPFAGLIYGASG